MADTYSLKLFLKKKKKKKTPSTDEPKDKQKSNGDPHYLLT